MKALVNIGFQFVLACALLICITCNPFDQTNSDNDVSYVTKKEHEFVVNQIIATTRLIELAEIGEQKGSFDTSSKSGALKDNQVAVLYYWVDYATLKNIRVPEIKPDNTVQKLYNDTIRFDEEWNKMISIHTASIVSFLTNHSLKDNQKINSTIENVLNTIGPQIDSPEIQLVAGN